MFNQDITIINKVFDSTLKTTTYKISKIKGFWSSNNGISINNTMLVKSDGVIVRILISENGYVSPKEYIGTGWTLKDDDYIIKGNITESSISSINEIINKYECMKITNIAIKDYGSYDMQHFEVSGE